MKMNYEYHPIANFFPMMLPEELESLTKDIQEHGMENPITLFENKILDGRNRYQACISSSINPKFIEYKGNSPYAKVMSLNYERRNLTQFQKACIATELLPFIEKEAKCKNIRITTNTGDERHELSLKRNLQSRDKAAKLTGTSGTSVHEFKN